MPSPEREATQVAKQADGSFDWDLWQVEYDRRLAERQQQLLGDARASYRAMGGWGTSRTRLIGSRLSSRHVTTTTAVPSWLIGWAPSGIWTHRSWRSCSGCDGGSSMSMAPRRRRS